MKLRACLGLAWIALLAGLSCRSNRPVLTDEFRAEISLTNPVEGMKVGIVVRTQPQNAQRGQLSLRRMSGSIGPLDYRERSRIRCGLADTMELAPAEFDGLLERILTDHTNASPEGRVTARVTIRDSMVQRSFVVAGELHDEAGLPGYVWRLFTEHFPESHWDDATIVLTHFNRTKLPADSSVLRVQCEDTSVFLWNNEGRSVIDYEEFVRLARVLETVRVWNLTNDTTLARKYPDEYILDIRSGSRRANCRVIAPSHVADRRYLEMITAIETLANRK